MSKQYSAFRLQLGKFLTKLDNLKPADRKALKAIQMYSDLLKALGEEKYTAAAAVEKSVEHCANLCDELSDKLKSDDLVSDKMKSAAPKLKALLSAFKTSQGMLAKLQKIEHRVDQVVRKDFIQLKKEHSINELNAINFD